MPRANRYLIDNQIYHLTHRCHDRQFLLKFARDRDAYRDWLRQAVQRLDISLLGCCITSNHVHLIAAARSADAISEMMDLVAGAVAGQYNRRKDRSGAFWSGRYHATMIESGEYLWNCLRYVDLNMVRAGVVAHPQQWPWCGYAELVGQRRRFRILDIEPLLEVFRNYDRQSFCQRYAQDMEATICRGVLEREPYWTEAIAVGSVAFVESVSARIEQRQRLQIDREQLSDGTNIWTVREQAEPWKPFSPPKTACKPQRQAFYGS